MARIIAYPSANNISSDDCLIGTQKDQNGTNQTNPTKNFGVGQVVVAGLGYTNYTALLSQVGIAAPVATVVKNNTNQTLTWSRSGTGVYIVESSASIFDAATTLVFGNIGSKTKEDYFRWGVISNTQIQINTFDGSGNPADDVFKLGSFEIRIYS